MINKNVKKKVFKELAESAAGQTYLYARLTDDVISYGNFIVTVTTEGYEAFKREGDEYVPVSFHCEHSSQYTHEIWEGEQYQISRREINENEGDEYVLWQVLWNLPHVGHYAFDPEYI